MQGIDPLYQEHVESTMSAMIGRVMDAISETLSNKRIPEDSQAKLDTAREEIVSHMRSQLESFAREHFVEPIISMVFDRDLNYHFFVNYADDLKGEL